MDRLVARAVAGLALAVMVGLAASRAQAAPTSAPAAVPVAAPAAGDTDVNARLDALTRKFQAQEQELEALRAQVTSGSNLATMTDTDRTLLAQMIKDEVARSDALQSKLPHWLDGLTFAGDIRLRYEGQWFPNKATGKSTPADYDRLRYRLRFGFTKDINEDWSAGFRLATGNGTDPFESNQTMTGDFVRNPVFVDLAWIQWKPKECMNGELTVVGGRFAPPFVGTDMTLDPDVTMSGIAENWTHKCTDELTTFATLAQTFLEQNRTNGGVGTVSGGVDSADMNSGATALMAYQLGLRYKITPDITWTLAGMYWEYINVNRDAAMGAEEAANQANNIPLGNSLLPKNPLYNNSVFLAAQNFDMLDLYNELAFKVGPNKTPLRVFTDEVWNLSDKAQNMASGNYKGQDFAAIGGVALGKINWKKGDWEIGYNYRYVQADSMVAIFSENAIWGTDKQGHSIAARYGVADNVTFNFRYVHFDWIVDKVDPARDLFRFEVEARF